jgi:hypothetical protein
VERVPVRRLVEREVDPVDLFLRGGADVDHDVVAHGLGHHDHGAVVELLGAVGPAADGMRRGGKILESHFGNS